MTGDGALAVRGGPGGTAARLDDLQAAGRRLATAAAAMSAIAAQIGGIATDPLPVMTLPLGPVTWWRAERSLAVALGGPAGALPVAARYTALSAAVLATVAGYRAADATAAAAMAAADAAAADAIVRLLALPALVTAGSALISPGVVLSAAASAPLLSLGGGAEGLLVPLAASPGAVEHLMRGAPLAAGVLTTVAGLLPGHLLLGETGRARVRAGARSPSDPPRGLADVLGGVARLEPDRGGPVAAVRVTSVTGPAGRAWIVEIPGTQTWSPRAGRNPFDLAGDVAGLARQRTAVQVLVTGALTAAGATSREPVLLAGHSQGGIVAADLAADPGFRARFRVTHIVTAGAPIGAIPVPPSVTVLALEHDHDLIPRLDGRGNPDRPGWYTVSARAERPGSPPDAVLSHDAGAYAETAGLVDRSRDPGLQRWREGMAPFLGTDGPAEAMVVTGEREPGP